MVVSFSEAGTYLLSLALLICCAWPTKSTSTVVAADPIKIGALLPFSGGVELYGYQANLGLDLGTKEINAGGGILGRPPQVIYENDKIDPAVAVDPTEPYSRPEPKARSASGFLPASWPHPKATRNLIERDGVLALVGPITSRNLNAIKPTIERMKTFTCSNKLKRLTSQRCPGL